MKHVVGCTLKGAFFSLVLLASSAVCALRAGTVWLTEDDYRTQAQGDDEGVASEYSLTSDELALTDEELKQASESIQKEQDDSALPTITAEGEFLTPTYVLPEALSEKEMSVLPTSGTLDNPWRAETKTAQIVADAEKTISSPSAVVLPGADVGEPPISNENKFLETLESQYQNTSLLLAETAKRLEALENGVQGLQESNLKMAEAQNLEQELEPRQPLLLPLAPLKTPSITVSEPASDFSFTEKLPEKVDYIDHVLGVLKRIELEPVSFSETDELVVQTIPQEMKLSFLPGSVDISGKSFKWIKAFSYWPKQSLQKAAEVRMSAQDIDLQSRRFVLIKGALLSNGLSPRQIRFVLTDRDPNTIVLRTIVLPDEQEVYYKHQKNGKVVPQIIRKW